MKKFLLFAAAALIVSSAGAQMKAPSTQAVRSKAAVAKQKLAKLPQAQQMDLSKITSTKEMSASNNVVKPDFSNKAPQKAAGGAAPSKPTKTSTAPSKAPEKKEIGKQDLMPGGRTYKASVVAHAKGQKAKDGGSIREAWAKAIKATQEQLDTFDHDVQTYRLDNNLKGVFEQ